MELAEFLMELSRIPNDPCAFLMEPCGSSMELCGFLMRPAVFHTVLRGFAVEPSALPIQPGECLGGVSGSRWLFENERSSGIKHTFDSRPEETQLLIGVREYGLQCGDVVVLCDCGHS
jgi:hypothetical protein